MRNNIPQIATPISHQFENEYYGKEISDVSDCLEVRERSLDSECENQFLFHIDIDLTHKWDENDFVDPLLGRFSNNHPHTTCRLTRGSLDQAFRGQQRGYGDRWVALTQLTGAC